LFTTSLSATYDIADNVSLFSIFDAVYAQSVGSDFERTRFTPTEAKFGADFLLLSSVIDIVPEFMIIVPFVPVDIDTDEIIPAEGVFEIRGGGYLSKRLDWF